MITVCPVTTRHHWLAHPEDRVIVAATLQGATAVLELTNKTVGTAKGQLHIDAEKDFCQRGQSQQEGNGCYVPLDTHTHSQTGQIKLGLSCNI